MNSNDNTNVIKSKCDNKRMKQLSLIIAFVYINISSKKESTISSRFFLKNHKSFFNFSLISVIPSRFAKSNVNIVINNAINKVSTSITFFIMLPPYIHL